MFDKTAAWLTKERVLYPYRHSSTREVERGLFFSSLCVLVAMVSLYAIAYDASYRVRDIELSRDAQQLYINAKHADEKRAKRNEALRPLQQKLAQVVCLADGIGRLRGDTQPYKECCAQVSHEYKSTQTGKR